MEKLHFLTAGLPMAAKNSTYEDGFKVLQEKALDGLEVEFVQGVRMSEKSRKIVKEYSDRKDFVFTAHAPYYVNLNAVESEKIEASIKRILDTARVANEFGGYSIVFHAAYYLGKEKEEVFQTVKKHLTFICDELKKEDNKIWVRPETTGKGTQWGDLDEIIKISKDLEQVLPCVDFAHLHARSNGEFNTYDEFSRIFEKIGTEIGAYALSNFHAHLAGIEYGPKGEKHHLILEESDMNYKDLLKAFKAFDIKGVLVCESPNIEEDTKLIKEYYETL